MKISRPKTEKWHNYAEGDCGKPLKKGFFYKKGFWKRYDRKKFFRALMKSKYNIEIQEK